MADKLTITGTPTSPVIGKAYSFAPTIAGGTSPYTVVASPSLPTGYTLDATTGTISSTGVPEGDSFTTTLRVTDSTTDTPLTADLSVTLTPIKLPEITNPALPVSEVGRTVSWTPQTQYGNGSAITVAIEASSLPAGLTASEKGVISGTPTKAGSYTISATVSDGTNTNTQSLTATVIAAVTLTGEAPKGYVISTYKFAPLVSAGQAPYTWTVSALPDGLSMDETTGVITGTFSTTGTIPLQISVTDALGGTASLSTSIDVIEATPLVIAIPGMEQNAVVSITLSASDASASATYALSGTLPKGLAFNASTATLTGTPLESGEFPVVVTITDGPNVSTRQGVLVVAGGMIPPGESVHPLDTEFTIAIDKFDTNMTADLTTTLNQTVAANQLLNATDLLLRAPTLLALNVMWAKHQQYATSLFGAPLFTTLLSNLSDRDADKLSVIHNAFHTALTAPTESIDYNTIIRIARQQHIVTYLKNKVKTAV